MYHHIPPGPVVIHIEAPVFKTGLDALLAADRIQPAGGLQQGFFPCTLTADDQALLAVVQIHVVVICRQVCQIQIGAVVVNQVVAVIAEELLLVIQAGDGEGAVEQIRAAVVEVCGVHSAHRCAEGHDIAAAAVVMNGGNHLIDNVVVPVLVILNAPAVVRAHSGPGFIVDGIHSEDHALAFFDPACPMVDHLEAFKVPETAQTDLFKNSLTTPIFLANVLMSLAIYRDNQKILDYLQRREAAQRDDRAEREGGDKT